MRESDVYASGPEEQKKLADKIRAEDLVIAARLDKGTFLIQRGPPIRTTDHVYKASGVTEGRGGRRRKIGMLHGHVEQCVHR